jgi:hypothetical protein
MSGDVLSVRETTLNTIGKLLVLMEASVMLRRTKSF